MPRLEPVTIAVRLAMFPCLLVGTQTSSDLKVEVVQVDLNEILSQ